MSEKAPQNNEANVFEGWRRYIDGSVHCSEHADPDKGVEMSDEVLGKGHDVEGVDLVCKDCGKHGMLPPKKPYGSFEEEE